MNVHRGDIYYADLSPVVGSEQGGVRPVLIVQNDVGNRFSPTVIAAAITSQRDKTNLPTHIALHAERTGLQKDSIVLLEQVRTIDKHRLKEKMASSMTTPCSASTKPSVSASAFTIHISKGRKNRAVSEKLRAARFALYLCFCVYRSRCKSKTSRSFGSWPHSTASKSLFRVSPIALP